MHNHAKILDDKIVGNVSELGQVLLNVLGYKYKYFWKVFGYKYKYIGIFSKVFGYKYKYF